jgi:SnoaL-like domain
MDTTASDPTATATEDRLAILELTARLALLLDARDWSALEQLFTDPARWDRTSLFGGEPETASPAEIVGVLRYALGGLDATHHLITCQVIDLHGDQATGSANMVGTHILANSTGDPVWTVGGRHDYEFKRTADGWRIAGVTFTVQWAAGNMQIVTLASGGGGS